jgi:hypothetical protein
MTLPWQETWWLVYDTYGTYKQVRVADVNGLQLVGLRHVHLNIVQNS